MAIPEALPLRTSDRLIFEVRPTTIPGPDGTEVEDYEWVRVQRLGTRLSAMASLVDYIQLREVRGIESVLGRNDKMIELTRIDTFYNGERVGGPEALPELRLFALVGKLVGMSSAGPDPFVEAPAGSLH